MIYKVSKDVFYDLLDKWQTNIWYYNKAVIEAAEKIAQVKGFEVAYFKIENDKKNVGIFPMKFKKKNFFFNYSELLISKDLGIDNIELLIDWNEINEEIFEQFTTIFSKTELHHLKIINQYEHSKYVVNQRKILFLETEKYDLNFSKNFKQNIRTAKNRINKNESYLFKFESSNDSNFINYFNQFADNHFNTKKTSSWNDIFFKQILNKNSYSNLNCEFLICDLEVNNETIGGIFGWISEGVFYFNQSFYYKEFSGFSPVVLIIDYFCQNSVKNHNVNFFDFMRGTESYKANFTKEFYNVCNIEVTSKKYAFFLKLYSLNFFK